MTSSYILFYIMKAKVDSAPKITKSTIQLITLCSKLIVILKDQFNC